MSMGIIKDSEYVQVAGNAKLNDKGASVQIHPSINTGTGVVNNQINSIPAGITEGPVLVASFEKPAAFKGKACLFVHAGMRLDTANVASHHSLQAVKSVSTMPNWLLGGLETLIGIAESHPSLANAVTISVPADCDYVNMSRFGCINNSGSAVTLFETGIINWILL